jgi:hypothetical protein
VSRDERALQAAGLNDPDVPPALLEGDMELLGLMPNASNYTFLARCTADGGQVLAVYKPRRGEIPLWDFPEGSLHRREVAAYLTSKALGWPNVPPTVLRGGPEGEGSAQLFVESDPSQHYFTLEGSGTDDFRRVAAFDVVVNNADRKGGHCLLSPDGRIWVVDHGVCFSDEPKLRTVIWTYAGERLPDDVRDDLSRLADDLHGGGALRGSLETLLDEPEVDATLHRVELLLDAGVFPQPGNARSFPWPPI